MLAAPAPVHPTDRACLIAWNAPANAADRARVRAARPGGVSLLPGVSYRTTWAKGSPVRQTAVDACLLTLAKPGRIQVVTGAWRHRDVARWTFGRVVPTTRPFFANVRLLADGRVAKIYRRSSSSSP